MTLLQNSFALDPTNHKEAARRFELASDMARRVPVFSLRYPRRYDALPEVIDKIQSVAKL
ncbi:hypothetical protein [Aliiruegeria lutimaris]|nr:hypothetical protein [Aliiruegeria lutimaris]